MATIRRNKYGRLMYAKTVDISGKLVSTWSPDPAAAMQVDDATAKTLMEAFEARHGDVKGCTAGQLQVLDAKGKVIAAAGEPGEEPKPVAPPVSLPGLAERVRVVEERVEMIEQADSEMIGNRIKSERQFTADEAAALKGMLAAGGEKKEPQKKEQAPAG